MIDLHSHTTASDGSLSPAALLDAAVAAGLTILGITDHDSTAGYREARGRQPARPLELVAGIEISAVAEGRDLHVLGYFIDPDSTVLGEFLARQRADRIRRVAEMSERLAALGCPIDAQPILDAAAQGRSVGRPQIASALLAAGHIRTRDEAFERFLEHGGPAYVARRGASPEEVVDIIHRAGGLASLAHPGVSRRDHLIPGLADAGLDAIEVRHSDHDAATETRYRLMAGRLGLLVTGGSDFHGDGAHRTPSLGAVTLDVVDFERLRDAAASRPQR